ncbi:MAG: patatin-like phospholipase family protein [Planctomycetota bacterium]
MSDGEDTYESIVAERDEILAPCSPGRYRVLKRLAENPENHLAVSFGGGSVPGIAGNCALAGILEELEILPHVKEIWGCSAGSIVGGATAAGLEAARMLEIADGLKDEHAVDFDWWEVVVKGIYRLLRRRELPDGIIRGRRIRDAIAAGLPVENIEECKIPYRAIAASDDGYVRKVVFREGPLIDAMMASMAIPGVFFPAVHATNADYGYFDGGLVEKTPLLAIMDEHKREGRTTNLVVLATHFDDRGRIEKPVGFLKRFMSTLTALEEAVWEYQVAEARRAPGVKVVMLNPRIKYGGMLNFELVRFNHLWCRKRFKEQLSNARLGMRFDAL